MASDVITGPKSLPASADLTAYQFRFMRINSSGQLALPTLGGYATTVLQDKPTAQGQPGQCCRPGDITRVYCSAPVNTGDFLSSDATGQAFRSVSGDWILGQSLETISVAGIVRMVFQPIAKL